MFNDLIRYQVQNPSGVYGRPVRRGAAVRKVLGRFKGDAGIVITDPHGKASSPVGGKGLAAKLTGSLEASTLGATTISSDKHTAKVRKIKTRIKLVATTGNERVDEYFSRLCAKFRGVRNLGALVCKTIGTTSSWSQHSNWGPLAAALLKRYGFSSPASSAGGNAIDSGNASAKLLDEMFRWTVANAAELDVENAIHWPASSPHPLIWNPEQGMHTYVVPPGGSDHRDHVHADFKPTRTGTPRC